MSPVCKMADKGRLTRSKVESCIVLCRNKECSSDSEMFSCTLWYKVGSLQTIYRLCQQFETNGSVLEKKRPCPASVRTPVAAS